MSNWFVRNVSDFIDFFYPPFRRYIPLQTFRYIACGGGNTLLDIIIYFISYNFILQKQVVSLGIMVGGQELAVSPHIMAFFMAFFVSFPLGFYLNRKVVFHDSDLRGRVQLFRYMLLVTVNILLNYAFIKLFVEVFGIFPTIAKMLTTLIVVTFSYLAQRNYTFRKRIDK
ncbi:GtrA family protein [Flavihumibacter sp. ZG627]|uniref:GtrA family protein n=1 Tax=Flavihumibacter sp. ZG627 TaxID=1463156 RepID=UPI00057E049A|nr:GtrA family protein [Flavihumibacter sp. ZG627]KIC91844.1 phenylalanine 4-monooxygenase [Flavihumibacter sp. ZG627]